MIELGTIATNFTAQTTQGEITLHDYVGDSWCFFFSHPRDFSAVCMTDLAQVSRLQAAFDQRNVKRLGLCIAPLEKHTEWALDFTAVQGCALNFPLVADSNGEVAQLYNMIHDEHMKGVTCRCFFIIDPNKKIRMSVVYPTTVARNFDEILRIIDSLQFTATKGLVTPQGWQPGEKGVIPPSLNDEQAKAKFPEGWESPAPYLRLVDPGDL